MNVGQYTCGMRAKFWNLSSTIQLKYEETLELTIALIDVYPDIRMSAPGLNLEAR